MERRNNYQIMAEQARKLFLNYDAAALSQKLHVPTEKQYLTVRMFSEPYRINLKTGEISRFTNNAWIAADSFDETLTLFDLVCDSREDRHLSGEEKNLQSFGNQIHRNLLEETLDPWAELFQREPEMIKSACAAMFAVPAAGADIAFTIPFFEDLCITLRFWFGDEDFAPSLRWFLDTNALQYLRYETMYYAISLLKERLKEQMKRIKKAQP